ncbi:hypothetical protein BDR04DRAFT_1170547 [Suillus decipiens]|nr:hypothetical protein BDR04DRAFT_1170547 [Suillus decipiens]
MSVRNTILVKGSKTAAVVTSKSAGHVGASSSKVTIKHASKTHGINRRKDNKDEQEEEEEEEEEEQQENDNSSKKANKAKPKTKKEGKQVCAPKQKKDKMLMPVIKVVTKSGIHQRSRCKGLHRLCTDGHDDG